MTERRRSSDMPFPWKAFLVQLFFSPLKQVVWSPTQFAYDYRIQLLSRCWMHNYQEIVDFLEQCWMKDSKKL